MECREDAILCQRLLRTAAVAVNDLVACADEQRAARAAGRPVPRLEELLLGRGLLSAERLELARRAALGLPATQRARRSGSSTSRRAPVDPDAVDLDGVAVGDRFGQYEVTSRVARGSMGAVFAARCVRTDARVALKVLAGERARSDTGARRFVHEAQLACSLRHDALVRGIAFGVDQGRRYFVMELVDGPSLRARLDGGAQDEREVARIGAQVARALAYLHAEGVVHRDVKPANILLDPSGQAKLCDLGLARELDVPSEATASGDTLGTPRYMAPEQARGAREVGPSADLYSLGVTLFHVATGRPPFTEESGVVVLSRHLFDEVPDARAVRPSLSPALAAIIWKLTRKEPERRHATALEAARELEALLALAPAPARQLMAA